MLNTRFMGKKSEDLAVTFLRKQGYAILTQNFRCRLGEIDIIARQGNEIVFVEVKSRSNSNFGLPQESVTKTKQDRIRKVALYYLKLNCLMEQSCRFDVVCVYLTPEGREKIEWIKNAF